jgi:hypothetical protein
MLYTFIWKSSVNRVKKDIMQKKYQEGGLKMINIHSFILALKSTWIRRLFFNNCKWQNIFMSSIDINKLSCGGSGYIEQVIESVKNQFWKDVLYAWKSVIEKDENKDWTNFLANTIWLNKQVKIDKRTIFYPEWFKHKHILPFTIVEKGSPDPCGLQSQNKRMYINHLKSPLLILLLHDIFFHSINR